MAIFPVKENNTWASQTLVRFMGKSERLINNKDTGI